MSWLPLHQSGLVWKMRKKKRGQQRQFSGVIPEMFRIK